MEILGSAYSITKIKNIGALDAPMFSSVLPTQPQRRFPPNEN